MLGMARSPWILIGILAYAVSTTLLSNWLVRGLKRPRFPSKAAVQVLVDAAANLVWIALLCFFGVLGIRYAERMHNMAIACLAFAAVGFQLSWVRAYLFLRIQDQRQPVRAVDGQAVVRGIVHWSSYLLWSLILYLALSWLLNQSVEPLLFIPLWIGALLPDLDTRDSPLGCLLPWLSRRLERRIGHLETWHTLGATLLVALLTAPLIWLFRAQAWYLIPLGFFSHLVLDLLAPRGVMLIWPLTRTRYAIYQGAIRSHGNRAERLLVAGLALVGLTLLTVVGLSRPEPVAAPSPTYQQTLERYYALRGRIQVFVYIDGSWQASGRPVSGRFEILNAAGESFIMLDRFGGRVFSAGRGEEDNVYLDRIVLQSGPAVTVKPVEVRLERQPLSDILDTLYEMQAEAGLQHIYVSGELVLPAGREVTASTLELDYSQTSLRRIQVHEAGHYSLQYLTAGEVIDLAALQVEVADLVIVATYVSPATGPTVTPLPSPAATAAPLNRQQ